MKPYELSLDVWNSIFEYGLTFTDLLNMYTAYDGAFFFSGFQPLWYNLLMKDHVTIQDWYRRPRAQEIISSCNQDETNLKRTCLSIYHKQLRFNDVLNQTESWKEIRSNYVGELTANPDYLPIIYNKYFLFENIIDLAKAKKPIELAHRSICYNLLLRLSFAYGYSYIGEFINKNKDDKIDPHELEQFWFHLSLLDKSNHEIIHLQVQTYNRIQKALEEEIDVKEFCVNEPGLEYQQEQQVNLDQNVINKPVIVVNNIRKLDKLIDMILWNIDKNLPDFKFAGNISPERFEPGFTYEDLSLFRALSGHSLGNPLLLNLVIIKFIDDFLLNRYLIKLPSGKKYPLELFQSCIKTHKGYYKLIPRYMSSQTDVFNGVPSSMGLEPNTSFSSTNPDSTLVSFRTLINLFEQHKKSIYHDLNTKPDDFKPILDLSLNSISKDDHLLKQTILKLHIAIQEEKCLIVPSELPTVSKPLYQKSSVEYFINFYCVYDYFLLDIVFKAIYDFPSFEREKGNGSQSYPDIFTRSHLKEYDNPERGFVLGLIVLTRRRTFGILLCYCKSGLLEVYTTDKQIERCEQSSVILISRSHSYFANIVPHVIKSCGENVLGLVYSHFDTSLEVPRFIPKKQF